MARIKFGALVTSIEGKIGGHTISRTQGGFCMKAGSELSKTIKSTAPAGTVIIPSLQNEWTNTSTRTRQSWSAFSKFCHLRQKHNKDLGINGHQLYLKVNFYRHLYSYNSLAIPVFNKKDFIMHSFTISYDVSNLNLNITPSITSGIQFVILQMTPPVSPGRNNPGSAFRHLIFATTTGTVISIHEAYRNVFGNYDLAGKTVFHKVSCMDLATGIFQPFIIGKTTLT